MGSSFIVLISFTWGVSPTFIFRSRNSMSVIDSSLHGHFVSLQIFVFGEHVHNRLAACFAVGCMMVGLLGMAYFSAPSISHPAPQLLREDSEDSESNPYHTLDIDEPVVEEVNPYHDEEEAEDDEQSEVGELVEALVSVPDIAMIETHTICCGMKVQKRTLGIFSAMFTGIYGGSIMAPMKYAPPDAKGTHFLISFAIGAAIVNFSIWLIRCLFLYQRHGSLSAAYEALPSFHIRKMWLPGSACGILWSIGNFFATISVQSLGEGVGYSVVQASMLGK